MSGSQDRNRRALARKYRPSTLAELVGQDGLAAALTRALETGRIAQAYLFAGIRGTGKTSTARILAAGLNCEHGPTAAPCGRCAACRSISEDRHLDVQEMDAASHTSVEGIRDLLDGVPYAPVEGRWKVYVIDEVHMLSKSAFNALLKTLEEPPEHVVFVFATTEVRKIPATIVSRCQRFDLRRVPPDLLVKHYGDICAREGVRSEPEAMRLIAQGADGSVRDGLSILDQAIARSDGAITAEGVRDMLGLAEAAAASRVLDAVLTGNPGEAIMAVRDLTDRGADPAALLGDIMARLHDAAVAAADPTAEPDPTLSDEERQRARDLGHQLGVRGAFEAWTRASEGLSLVRGPDPDRALEMVLLAMSDGASGRKAAA